MSGKLREQFGARHSLRRRVISAMSLIMLFGTVLTIGGVLQFVYRAERDSWQSRQDEAARSAALTVEEFIRQEQEYLAVVGLLDHDYLEASPHVLSDLLAENEALLEIIRVDEKGIVFAAADRGASGVLANLFTIAQSNWFLQALDGHSYVGELQISATSEPYLILAVPAHDGGVVAARLSMDVLWNVVSGIRFGQTGQAYVIDQHGNILAHQDTQLVLQRTSIAERPETIAMLQEPGYHWSGLYSNLAGVNVVGVTTPIFDGEWIIFTEVAQTETFAMTGSALTLLAGGGIVLGGVLIVVAQFLLRRLFVEPMEKLREGTERVGRGDLSYRLGSPRRDEIGQVAMAFDEMAARLQEREEALAEARDEALAASHFKSRLLANVSHDLRTPLNSILGYTEMLGEEIYGPLNDEQRAANERILANAQRLLTLIGGLLDQSRIEAGKVELTSEPFHPADLMDEMTSVMGILAGRKGLRLTTSIDPQLPTTLVGDPKRLHQILMNLVGNAIKFTEQGGVQVEFYRREQQWVIRVSDSGPGIPQEAHRYIFEPFRRVDDSTTREKDGVGLGLSIVHQLTSLMGGEIELDSQVGRGSTFRVFLPLEPQGVEQDEPSAGMDR